MNDGDVGQWRCRRDISWDTSRHTNLQQPQQKMYTLRHGGLSEPSPYWYWSSKENAEHPMPKHLWVQVWHHQYPALAEVLPIHQRNEGCSTPVGFLSQMFRLALGNSQQICSCGQMLIWWTSQFLPFFFCINFWSTLVSHSQKISTAISHGFCLQWHDPGLFEWFQWNCFCGTLGCLWNLFGMSFMHSIVIFTWHVLAVNTFCCFLFNATCVGLLVSPSMNAICGWLHNPTIIFSQTAWFQSQLLVLLQWIQINVQFCKSQIALDFCHQPPCGFSLGGQLLWLHNLLLHFWLHNLLLEMQVFAMSMTRFS